MKEFIEASGRAVACLSVVHGLSNRAEDDNREDVGELLAGLQRLYAYVEPVLRPLYGQLALHSEGIVSDLGTGHDGAWRSAHEAAMEIAGLALVFYAGVASGGEWPDFTLSAEAYGTLVARIRQERTKFTRAEPEAWVPQAEVVKLTGLDKMAVSRLCGDGSFKTNGLKGSKCRVYLPSVNAYMNLKTPVRP